MILGLSHIAISTDGVEAATQRLAALGYELRFDEPALENHAAKTPLLSCHQPTHHIRALFAEDAMAIELLDHGSLSGQQAATLIPVFRSEAPLPDWEERPLESLPIAADGVATLRVALGRNPRAFFDTALKMTLLWLPAEDEAPGLYACALPTTHSDATATLLSQLRFRPDAGGIWSLLTPLPALQARLIPVPTKAAKGWSPDPLLDAPGCACLALMARDTDHASLPVALQGETASFTLVVNGKTSRITLARPYHGPIMEMIEQPT